MKKLLLLMIVTSLLFPIFSQNEIYQRCATDEYMQYLIDQQPRLKSYLETMENTLNAYLQSKEPRSEETVIVIPVVVHVIWRTTGENISENMVRSQIRVLNEDFRKMAGSPGWNNNAVGADTRIEFRLAEVDPNGQPHTGINRVQTTRTSFHYINDNAYLKSLSYWPSDKYLNLWTCNLSNGILGYAQFPGGPAATDGVVILYSAFGYNSPANPYNLGRTTTHEIGHWINLRHTWGDGGCEVDDLIDDTPLCSQDYYSSYSSCFHPVQCSFTRQIENYMDYSDDGCMNIYTVGQRERMRAAMNVFRYNLLWSQKEKKYINIAGADFNYTDVFSVNYATVNFASLGTLDSLEVEVFPNQLPTTLPLGTKAVKRYFKFTGNGTGFNATVKLYYKDAEVIGFNNGDANLKVYRFNGTDWIYVGGTVNAAGNYVTITGVNEFGIFAFSDPGDDPIPVELRSFTFSVKENNVALTWITATETNNLGFEVERKFENPSDIFSKWETAGFVKSSSNSSETKVYGFSDNNLRPGSYSYRLKIIDLDGTASYSNTIFINITAPSVYFLEQNYPNPFNPSTKISYRIPIKGNVQLRIFDALGKEVALLLNEEQEPGEYSIMYSGENLTSGVYFYTLKSGSFLQTNKMLLMK